jgi:hypothetical protein
MARHNKSFGRERREREVIADFQLPIGDWRTDELNSRRRVNLNGWACRGRP